MSGFVYIWFDRKHRRFYLGSHWGLEDDGYICSSSWMKKAYKKRPNDFRRRILRRIYTNREDLLKEEQCWLNMISSDELGDKYYNFKQRASGCGGKPLTESHKAKISENHAWKGKKRPEHSKALTGRKRSPLSEEAKRKMSIACSGRICGPCSEERKKRISLSNKGRKWSQESKLKICRPKERTVCQICSKLFSVSTIKRHMEKCIRDFESC